MNWAQVVLPFILGLVVISWQSVHAQEAFTYKGSNSTKPGNRTGFEAIQDDHDHDLYMTFACRGKVNGLHLPIAGSCVNYYECQQGVANRRTCKSGMHFSHLALTCLDARLSKCNQEEATANCEGLCCGRDNGLYPAKGSCSDFLICVDGQTIQGSCGGNLQFSAANQVCDIPERAGCSDVANGTEAEADDLESAGVFVKPTMYVISHRVCQNQPDGSAIPIQGSCNKFYLCIGSVGYLKSCGNLQFNPQKRFCDARTRMYCPLIEQDDVILNEDEYVQVDVRPLPVPRPRPGLRPIPLNPVKEQYEIEPPYFDFHGKSPGPESEKKPTREEEKVNKRRPRPSFSGEKEDTLESGKKPAPQERENVNKRRPIPSLFGEKENALESGRKPAPQEEEKVNKLRPRPTLSGEKENTLESVRKPAPQEEEKVNKLRPIPSLLGEKENTLESGRKPAPQEEEKVNKLRPRPTLSGEKENTLDSGNKPIPEEPIQSIWGKKQFPRPPALDKFEEEQRNPSEDKTPAFPRPPVPVDFEDEQQTPVKNTRPIVPRPSNSNPNTPSQQVVTPDEEEKVPTAYLNVCANQPVGALMAMPDNCSKFIRCRWDWFDRRAAEIVNCPTEMHFNAKSKKCDWPANAGCIAFSKKVLTNDKKQNQ